MSASKVDALSLGFVADPNSVHTRRWISWFARTGHRVHLIDLFGMQIAPGLAAGITVHQLDLPSGPPLVGLPSRRRGLHRHLESIGLEVLHAHFVRRYGWQAALSGFHPLVISPWGSDLLRVRRRSLRTRWWNRFALRSADLVTVSSEGMRAAAVKAGARSQDVHLVHHGVDTTVFTPRAMKPQVPSDSKPRVLSIRSLTALYRHETVIDAVAMLGADGLRPELVMTKHGADPGYLESVRRRAHDRGIEGQLLILDPVGHGELPDLYRSASVLVSVPETDSYPVTVLEAMACGLPAVVSDLPAVAPVYSSIDPLAANLTVPVGDVEATAAALRLALSLDERQRRDFGDRLRAYVISTADYDTHMRRMEHLYRGLVTA